MYYLKKFQEEEIMIKKTNTHFLKELLLVTTHVYRGFFSVIPSHVVISWGLHFSLVVFFSCYLLTPSGKIIEEAIVARASAKSTF